MATTAEPQNQTESSERNVGRIEEIQGVVIEAVFPDKLPEINSAIEVRRPVSTTARRSRRVPSTNTRWTARCWASTAADAARLVAARPQTWVRPCATARAYDVRAPSPSSACTSGSVAWAAKASRSSSGIVRQCRYSELRATPDRSLTSSTVTPSKPTSLSSSHAAAMTRARVLTTRGSGAIRASCPLEL